MKRKILAAIALLFGCCGLAWGDTGRPTGDLASFITSTMTGNTSSFRKESYQSAAFEGCTLNYTVSGTYPAGGLYTIRFQGIDFSTLDVASSKIGQDYTDYVVLRFDKPFTYASETDRRYVSTTVINVDQRKVAQDLFDACLRFAAQCRATPPVSPPGTTVVVR